MELARFHKAANAWTGKESGLQAVAELGAMRLAFSFSTITKGRSSKSQELSTGDAREKQQTLASILGVMKQSSLLSMPGLFCESYVL